MRVSSKYIIPPPRLTRCFTVCNLPSEDESNRRYTLSSEWPSSGAILVQDLCIRYRDDLPDVLQHISLEIKVSTFQQGSNISLTS